MGRTRRTTISTLCACLTLTTASPALANPDERPPVQRPSSPIEGPAPAPVEAPPGADRGVGEAREADDAEAAIVLPEPDPGTRADTLPSYRDPLAPGGVALELGDPSVDRPTATGREVPHDGRGMMAAGAVVGVGGVSVLAGTIAMGAMDYGVEIWGSTLALGMITSVTSAALLGTGRRRNLAYREWAEQQPDEVPAQGTGMIASGSVLLTGGAMAGMFGTIGMVMSNVGFQPEGSGGSPVPATILGLGVGSLALGATLMGVGIRRHKRFEAWRHADDFGSVQLSPSLAPMPGGGQIGLVGRF